MVQAAGSLMQLAEDLSQKCLVSRALTTLIMAVHVYGYFKVRRNTSIGRSQSGLWTVAARL
jgi:hypothetical protein